MLISSNFYYFPHTLTTIISCSVFSTTWNFPLNGSVSTPKMNQMLSIVWHKSLLSKLPSFGFYPSLCSFISSFLSGRSISAVVDGQCSSPKPINSCVPQVSVPSPTLFLLFINDPLSVLSIHILMTPLCTFRLHLTENPPYRTYKTPDWRLQNA